jgi:hypothetical protein
MTNPSELHVIGKKAEVADRTLNERKFCAIDDYYYSEMFTCPICYGRQQERQRYREWLERIQTWHPSKAATYFEGVMAEHHRIINLIENDTDMEINSGKMVFSQSGERVTPERLVEFLSVENAK